MISQDPAFIPSVARSISLTSTTSRFSLQSNQKKVQFVRCKNAKWYSVLPEKMETLVTELGQQTNTASRYMKLVELGERMISIPEEELTVLTRVSGCTSITHVSAHICEAGTINLKGYSDARISRGLVALLALGLHGCSAAEILNLNISELLRKSALPGVIGSSRINGLGNIYQVVRKQVQSLHDNISSLRNDNEHILTGRWSERQGEDVAVLLSGGVDSSVAMRLALESGARPHPFYLKIWLEDELAHLGECPWQEDIEYANAVCKQVGLKLQDVPFQRAYWDEVVSYTVQEARKGRTPNPDVMCNSRIKFGAFYDRIGKHYDKVVTGHYAQTTRDKFGRVELRLSSDELKDQTYFLAHLRQDQIATACFPVGRYTKNEVRTLAERYNLPNKNRKDSQGICFLGKLKFDDFLAHHLGQRKGSLVEFETGQELGSHNGFWFFTLGQRRGVGLSGGPWYVVAKDISQNIVYVSKEYNSVSKERNCFEFDSALWISTEWPTQLKDVGHELRLKVKTRHGPRFHNAILTRLDREKGRVVLEGRDKGLAPGQFSAFYDYEGRCLGSGVIRSDVSLPGAPAEIKSLHFLKKKLQAHVR
ncbi:tRNA methyl transferase [Gracilaria domingensis]|nr:tRNA methyl transferase [Gracilaria domingensis]